MYADRHSRPRVDAGSLAVALGINGAIVAALLFASPEIRGKIPIPPLIVEPVPIDPPPPPEPPQTKPQPQRDTRATPERVETSRAPTSAGDPIVLPPYPPLPPQPPQPGPGGGAAAETPPAPPVLVDAAVDATAPFQPDYPPSERRAEREGVVRIRVLIGSDGRVKQAERIEAASDAFWRATERQALSRWRFRPATRDGAAIEQWRTFTVRFRLEG